MTSIIAIRVCIVQRMDQDCRQQFMKNSNHSFADYQNLSFGEFSLTRSVLCGTLLCVCVCRLSAIRSILIALFCTFFSLFNIPVFWPILVVYFIMLLVITMRRQIKVSFNYTVVGSNLNFIYVCSYFNTVAKSICIEFGPGSYVVNYGFISANF